MYFYLHISLIIAEIEDSVADSDVEVITIDSSPEKDYKVIE